MENNKPAEQWRQDIYKKNALEILNIISNFKEFSSAYKESFL